ncbi:MAG: hypothetical protein LC676_02635 [Loktanella sp.]|nr:hypothetical protein [Loktanella sp.]
MPRIKVSSAFRRHYRRAESWQKEGQDAAQTWRLASQPEDDRANLPLSPKRAEFDASFQSQKWYRHL